jgi:MFS family permease
MDGAAGADGGGDLPRPDGDAGGDGRLGPGFGRLVLSSGLSNLADGVFTVALPLVTLQITRDPGAMGAVVLSLRLPWLLFALPAGALADRLDRRRTMLLVDVGRGVVVGMLALVVAAGGERLWLLCGLAFLLGTGETLFDTAAQSIVPNLVRPQQLSRANGRLQASELVMNQFVGPPLGGLLAGVTLAGALGTTATAYLLAAVALALVVGSFRPARSGEPTTLRRDVVDGVRYLFGQRLLRTMAVLTGIANLGETAVMTVLPVYAIRPGPMGLPEAGYGMLLAAPAVGAFAGSFAVPAVERRLGRATALRSSLLAIFLLAGLPALTTSGWVVGAGFVVVGASTIVWNVIAVSLRQRISPDHLLGRVNAGYRLLAWGSMPLGALLGGILGELFGLRAVFLLAAGGQLLAVPLLFTIKERRITAAEREAAAT